MKTFNRPRTCEEMRAHADNLIRRADAMLTGSWDRITPGPLMTGSSGWQKNFGKASDRSWRAFENAGAKAQVLREAAAKWRWRANQIDPEWIRLDNERRRFEEQAREREHNAEKAERAGAILINDPSAPNQMTSAEWSKVHRDYKTISVKGSVKIRYAMNDGKGLRQVFLTDKPVKLVPVNV